jgi:hypothetical protein
MKNKKTVSKKKKEKKKEAEEEKLEEEIEKAEKEIEKEEMGGRREQIKEFLMPAEVKAPVLERVIIREPVIPTQNQFEMQQKERTEERKIDYGISNEPKYSAGRDIQTEQEEKKYETTFIPPVLTRRETQGREEFFRQTKTAWGEAKQINETPQQFEALETTRKKLPFEEEQKKYKRVKFRI